MSSTASVQRSSAIPDYAASSARDKAPDFRARAMAKQAWLVRRSAPRRGLLFGLIAGGAIGCLGAFAVMSVVPSGVPARATANVAVTAANQPASAKAVNDASTPAVVAATVPATNSAPTTPRTDLARTELSSNAKVVAVTPAEPPATRSLTSETPILAQGGTPESKPKVAEKKKKKKVAKQRNNPARPNDWARRDNFGFGGDRMTNNF